MNILFTPPETSRPTLNSAWNLPNSWAIWTAREISLAGKAEKERVGRALFAATQRAKRDDWSEDNPQPDTNAVLLWGKTMGIMDAATRAHLAAVIFRGPAWELGTITHGLVLGEGGLEGLPYSRMTNEQFARHVARPAIVGALYADLSPGPDETAVVLPEHCHRYDAATGMVLPASGVATP